MVDMNMQVALREHNLPDFVFFGMHQTSWSLATTALISPDTQDQLLATAHDKHLSKKFARREVPELSHECGERWHNLHDKLRQAIQPYAQRNGEELEMCSCCAWLSVTRGWFPWLTDVMP